MVEAALPRARAALADKLERNVRPLCAASSKSANSARARIGHSLLGLSRRWTEHRFATRSGRTGRLDSLAAEIRMQDYLNYLAFSLFEYSDLSKNVVSFLRPEEVLIDVS